MKTITFVYPKMVMGGAEKALINLVNSIDREKYKVNVILLKRGGELEHSFPKDVRIEYAELITISNCVKHIKILSLLRGIYYRLRIRISKTYEEKSYWTSKVYRMPKTVSNECVICYSHYNFLSICLTAQCKSKHKILWVHLTFRENRNQQLYEKMLSSFDGVFCVSKASKNNFDICFPQYSYKSQVVYNLIDKEKIFHDSLESVNEKLQHPCIVTVGRLDYQKGLDLIPNILSKLIKKGHDLHWYIVGEGEYHSELIKQIEEKSLNENLIIIGNKTNPYPYMKECDIYCQPSRYEGFCTTTNEARLLCKPIVASNIEPMKEQFVNGENAFLCDLNTDSFCFYIEKLLLDKSICKKFSDNLINIHVDNRIELEKIYKFIS